MGLCAEKKTGVLPTILYVNDEGMEVDGMEYEGEEGSGLARGVLDTLVREGNLVVAVDVRGIGETRPLHAPNPATITNLASFSILETGMAYMAWFMNQSLLGMRVQDVVQSVDYITSRKDADANQVCM